MSQKSQISKCERTTKIHSINIKHMLRFAGFTISNKACPVFTTAPGEDFMVIKYSNKLIESDDEE